MCSKQCLAAGPLRRTGGGCTIWGTENKYFFMEQVSTFFWTRVFLAGEVQSPPLWIFPWTNVWSCHREKGNMTNWPMWPPLGQKLFGQCQIDGALFRKGLPIPFHWKIAWAKFKAKMNHIIKKNGAISLKTWWISQEHVKLSKCKIWTDWKCWHRKANDYKGYTLV